MSNKMNAEKVAALSMLALAGWSMNRGRIPRGLRGIRLRRPQQKMVEMQPPMEVAKVKPCPVKGKERNATCPCGSGKKIKKCDCWRKPADGRMSQ